MLNIIATLPSAVRSELDDGLASSVRDDYAKFDIINRSYGERASLLAVIDRFDAAQWYERHLPKTVNALWQIDTPDVEKTILVYAAGNDSDRVPGLGAGLPYFFPDLRDTAWQLPRRIRKHKPSRTTLIGAARSRPTGMLLNMGDTIASRLQGRCAALCLNRIALGEGTLRLE